MLYDIQSTVNGFPTFFERTLIEIRKNTMAFVNEIIPESAKAEFKFPVKTLSDGSKPTLWKWTIDKARDIVLITTSKEGGTYEGSNEARNFMLQLQNRQVTFTGDCKYTSKSNIEIEVEWIVSNICPIDGNTANSIEIEKIIVEALTEMGWLYSTTNVSRASVAFDRKSV